VKARSQPETSAGLMPGRVIRHNTSTAARRDRGRLLRGAVEAGERARTKHRDKQAVKVACAIVTVTSRGCRPAEHLWAATNSNSNDRPRMTWARQGRHQHEADTRGARETGPNRSLQTRRRLPRTARSSPPSPRFLRLVRPRRGIYRVDKAPSTSGSKPGHTVTSREPLNE